MPGKRRVRVRGRDLCRSAGIPALVAGCLATTACGGILKPPARQVSVEAQVSSPATSATAVVPAVTVPPTAVATAPPSVAPPPSTSAPSRPPAAVVAVRPQPAPVVTVPRTSGSVAVRPAAPTAPPTPPPAPPPPPPPAAYPAAHLVGPGVDVLVSPMAPYDCHGYSPPLPEDRAIIDPCAQPVTGVPLIDGHNHTNLLWNASTTWTTGTVVRYGGHTWRIVQTRVVDHYITYYPMPPAGAGLQIRTCQPDGIHEWVWDLIVTA